MLRRFCVLLARGQSGTRRVPPLRGARPWLRAFALVVVLGLLGALSSPVAAQNPSTDATLSGLTLSEGRLDLPFASGTTSYAAAVGYTVTRITVLPTTTDANATVAYLDGSDMPLPDANTVTDEQDVDLVVGETVVKVKVTAEYTSTVLTYTLTITRTAEDTSLSPPASDPVAANPSTAVYTVTFKGAWTTGVTPDGVPSGAHFSPLVGGVHNAGISVVESGGTASAGVESMAEVGGTAGLEAEVVAAMADALAVLNGSGNISPTASQSLTATLSTEYPRLTLLTMVAPSPDWFVGVSGLPLLDDQGRWLRSHEVDLFPWDAGTEDGSEFSLDNLATTPQGTIESIRGTGKFSTEPIASLCFTLRSVSTTRSVVENTAAGVDIGAPVTATAYSGTVTYTLGGTDAASFDIVAATGQLQTKVALDYETKSSYEVTVTATDTDGSVTTTVAIEVTNVIELTTFSGPTMVTFAENGATRVATFSYSSDEDRDGIQWLTGGVDRGLFSLDSPSGALRFLQAPDFENPLDVGPPGRGTDNGYELKLVAWARDSGSIFTDEVDVKVTVTDVDEAGALSLSSTRPALGSVLTAVLTDPDGITAGTAVWQWERNDGREGWLPISGATAASYTPTAADGDRYLRVTATYSDSLGTDNTAEAIVPNVVIVHQLSALSVGGLTAVTGDDRVFYPAFDQDTLHYAARCSDPMTLTLTAQSNDTRIAVNGVQRPQGSAISLAGLARESDIQIRLTGEAGGSTTYFVHCLDGGHFPKLTTVKATGALEDLLLFGIRSSAPPSWLVMVDNNGVPRLRYRVGDLIGAYFWAHPDENRPHVRYSFEKRGSSFAQDGAEMVVLDRYFNVLDDDIHVKAPYNGTNPHDQQVTPGGNYVLMGYSRHQHDLRFLQTAYPDLRNENGDMLSENEPVRDGVVQVQKPDGTVVLNWSSWDHLAIEDCTGSSFRDEYAHINSLGLVDGDIIAGFRQCSKILRIDGDTGDVIWRAGPSILTRDQWEAGETLQPDRGAAPLDFINDPRGGFSGQHGGHMTNEGNLLVYDNATHCLHPPGVPTDTKGVTECSGERARAVEYALDTANGEMVFLREFVMPATDPPGVTEGPGGHAEPMDNGDWLVSWSNTARSGTPMPNTAMHVDARTGTAKLTLTMHIGSGPNAGDPTRARVTVISPVALATRNEALQATFPASERTHIFHTGASDSPQVVVAFNRPVVDFDETSTSLSVTGATVASVSAHVVAGEPANAYLVTLTPDGDGAISFRLGTGQACGANGGICTADGTMLSAVPSAPLVIAAPVTVSFEQATYTITEGASRSVAVRLSSAHQGARGLTVPVMLDTSGIASRDDLVAAAASVTFEAGETSKTLTVNALDDALVEGHETATLEFGALPDGVTAGSTSTATITIADADGAQIDFTTGAAQVSEGGETQLTFTITNGVTFEVDQTINLTVEGTATEGDDFTLVDAGNQTLSDPYAVTFPAGATSAEATIRAVDDAEIEHVAETITVSAQLDLTGALGTHTVTIPPSDVPATPVVTIAPGSGVDEGTDATFTLSRTASTNLPLSDPLMVSVEVTATGSTLGGSRPGTATFEGGDATADLAVLTLDDSVVEPPGTVTALIQGSTTNPPVYLTSAINSATVTVNDNDVAAFMFSAGATEVAEGGRVQLTITADGVTFAEPQTITLTLGGTATPVDDFTLSDGGRELSDPYVVTLPAGARAVSVTIMAVTDSEDDADETIELSVSHEGSGIGSVTITITEAPIILPPVITGGGGGGPSGPSPSEADFEWTVTHDIDELDSDHGSPTGAWSDGATLWLLENGDGADDAIYAYDLVTGERQEDLELDLDERNRAPRGVWSGSVTLWVSDSGQDELFAHERGTGERLPEFDIGLAEGNRDPRGIWSDEVTMWVLDGGKDALFAYDLATGDFLAEYALDSMNDDPHGLWSDRTTVWVSNHDPKHLFAYRLPVPDAGEPAEGEDEADEVKALERVRDEEFDKLSRASNNSPRGIWSDGDIMYVADESDDKVYTYNMPDAIDARLATLNLSGVDIGEFDGRWTEYEGVPGEGVTETTVEATTVQRRTAIAIDPPDADGNEANGHQVSLDRVEEITVTVTSADGARTRVYRVTVQRPEVELALAPTWTSIAWPGADGTPIVDALRDGGISDRVLVIYEWDEATAAWLAFFPGLDDVPGLNTLTTFTAGGAYWIAVGEPLTWSVAKDTADGS